MNERNIVSKMVDTERAKLRAEITFVFNLLMDDIDGLLDPDWGAILRFTRTDWLKFDACKGRYDLASFINWIKTILQRREIS